MVAAADRRLNLGAADCELIRSWADSGNELRQMRMRTARMSEIAAAVIYGELGHSTRDVSITQLTDSDDWRQYDLLLDRKTRIDVKSARRLAGRPTRYSRHLVPTWKTGADGDDVRISGMLAPYLRAQDWADDSAEALSKAQPFVMLGETDLARLRLLRTEFGNQGLVADPGALTWLPPWVFDEPERHRALRLNIARAAIEDAPPPHALQRLGWTGLPRWLAAGVPLPPAWLSALPLATVETYLALLDDGGPRLPRLFLGALARTLAAALVGGARAELARVEQVLIDGDAPRHEVVYDPLNVLGELVTVLRDLLSIPENELAMQQFDGFRFRGQGILRGVRANGEEETLLAYCGGDRSPGVQCARPGLVLGRESTCTACRRLVCPDCGFCSPGCRTRPCPGSRR